MKNDKKSYVKMGAFVEGQDGEIHGHIFGFGLGKTPVVFQQRETKEERQPYFRVVADYMTNPYEIGAAFPKEKDGRKYYSVAIDSPILLAPINAALFPDGNNPMAFNLMWNRPEADKAPKAAAEASDEQTAAPARTQKPGKRSNGSQPRPH